MVSMAVEVDVYVDKVVFGGLVIAFLYIVMSVLFDGQLRARAMAAKEQAEAHRIVRERVYFSWFTTAYVFAVGACLVALILWRQ